MKDSLPRNPLKNECGIINLDNSSGPGTHWVAYKKTGTSVIYFDSFGNLQPPQEIVKYIGSRNKIFFNHDTFQSYNSFNCGQLCIHFLYELNKV